MSIAVEPYFHCEHGFNVQVSADLREATRKRGFDNGLCALADALSTTDSAGDKRFSFLVTRTDARWFGGLSLGVSHHKPLSANMPSNAGSCAKGWIFAQVPQEAVAEGTLVTAWIDRSSRALCYVTSNLKILTAASSEQTSVLLDDPELLDYLDAKQPLWFYLDLYGYVVQVKIFGKTLLLIIE